MKTHAITAAVALALGLAAGYWLTSNSKAAELQRYETRIAQMQGEQDRLRLAALRANSEALQANTEKANTAALLAAKQEEKIDVEYRTVTKVVEKIVDRPVYRNVCLDLGGVRQLNDFIRGAGD